MKNRRLIDSFPGALALTVVVGLNVIVYLHMAKYYNDTNFTARQVYLYGNRFFGPYWESLPSTYIHFGLIHILSNMLALIGWGWTVARRLGFWKFLLLYTLCGLASSAVSLASHEGTVCAGASGPVSGVLACLFIVRLYGDRTICASELISVVVFNAFIAFVMPNIDWQAHIGGFAAGLVLGLIFVPRYLLLSISVVAGLVLILVAPS